MKPESLETQEMDRILRGLHAAATTQLSHSTLVRLRVVRHRPARAPRRGMGTWRWMAAGLGSAGLVVAVVLQMPPSASRPEAPAAAPLATASPSDGYPTGLAALEEDPEFFIWLAAEAAPLQLEQP